LESILRDRVDRRRHGPERAIQTGIGPVAIQRGEVRDRPRCRRRQNIRFDLALLRYLCDVSTGGLQEAPMRCSSSVRAEPAAVGA
jgi:hypothetical protein